MDLLLCAFLCAKDDAAGQAIANRMSSQINGLAQAQRNSNDGISVSQTAEGALNQVNDNLQRVRELTVQAQNGTNSQEDLNSIQSEIDQRLTEIDRISEQTDFNGVKVLQEDNSLKIQVGANDNESININLQKTDSTSLGLNTFTVSGDAAAKLQTLVEEFGATGSQDFDADIVTNSATTAADEAIEVDIQSGKVTRASDDAQLFVSQTTGNITDTENNTTGATPEVAEKFSTDFQNATQGDTSTIGGVTFTRETPGSDADGNGIFSATIEGKAVEVEVTGATTGSGGTLAINEGSLRLDGSTVDGGGAFVVGTTQFTTFNTNENASIVDVESAGATSTGATLSVEGNELSVDTSGQVSNQTGGDITLSGNTVSDGEVVFVRNAGQASQELVGSSDAQQASRDPLAKLDAALSTVDSFRSELGAIQNRFESAISNLSTNETNLSAARSRIEDADYAVEVADMTKNQILQQAGTSVLAQANQLPQNVLSLLG